MLTIKGVFGQNDPNKNVLTINGYTLDQNSKDTIPLTLVELLVNNELILVTKSDLNGQFKFILCLDRVENNKTELILTSKNYEQKRIEIKADKTFKENFFLQPDPYKKIDQEKYIEYSLSKIEECGTDRIDKEMALNRYYKHCDGRVKRYNDIDSNENMNLWTPIE